MNILETETKMGVIRKLHCARTAVLSLMAMTFGLWPLISVAQPIMTTDLLLNLRKGEPWD
jgi:hypothetical protein